LKFAVEKHIVGNSVFLSAAIFGSIHISAMDRFDTLLYSLQYTLSIEKVLDKHDWQGLRG
jgi:hypothetical protein